MVVILLIILIIVIMLCLSKWKRGKGPENPGFEASIAESTGPSATFQFEYFDFEGGTSGRAFGVQPDIGANTMKYQYLLHLIADLPVAGTLVKNYGIQTETGDPVSDRYAFIYSYGAFTAGQGYWEVLRLYHSVDGVYNIDLNDPANLTGLYTVNAADLIFQPNATHEQAVEETIENALWNANGYQRGTDYEFRYSAFSSSGSISFNCRHQNPGGWLGIKDSDPYYTFKPNDATPTQTAVSHGGSSTSVSTTFEETGLCSTLSDSFYCDWGDISGEVIDYNSITYADQTLVPTDGGINTVVCPSSRLTVSLTGTATGPAYDWEYNDGSGFTSLGLTSNIIDVVAPGTYRCKVTAAEGVVFTSFVIPDF